MKINVEMDPETKQSYWFTDDRKFYGVIVEPVTLESADEPPWHLPAAALLAVPKYSQGERPSINKYSPVIVKAEKAEDVPALVEEWLDENKGKPLWELRRP